jgi:broad specificity phosphatase PhoE
VELSENGKKQAIATGQVIGKEFKFDRVFTSPLKRTKQTAELLVGQFPYKVDTTEEERLREIDFGILDGLTKHGVKHHHPEEATRKEKLKKYYYRPPAGENWPDVALRIHSFLGTLTRDAAGDSVLVVCHAVVVLVFRKLLERLSEDDVLEIDKKDVVNCSVTHYLVRPQLAYRTVAVVPDQMLAPSKVKSRSPRVRFSIALHSLGAGCGNRTADVPSGEKAAEVASGLGASHFLRSGFRAKPAELRQFLAILREMQLSFSCIPDCVAERDEFELPVPFLVVVLSALLSATYVDFTSETSAPEKRTCAELEDSVVRFLWPGKAKAWRPLGAKQLQCSRYELFKWLAADWFLSRQSEAQTVLPKPFPTRAGMLDFQGRWERVGPVTPTGASDRLRLCLLKRKLRRGGRSRRELPAIR